MRPARPMERMARPSPLSDEVCASTPAPVLLGAPNNVLGLTNDGVPLPVKNTFLDMPTGLTPASLKHWREPMMTAPAGLGKKMGGFQAPPVPEARQAPGFLGETPPATPQSINGYHYTVTTPTSVPSYSGAVNGGAAGTPPPQTPTPYMPMPYTPTPTTPGSGAAGGSSLVTAAPGLQDQLPLWNAGMAAPTIDAALGQVAWGEVADEADEGDSDDDSEDGLDNSMQLQLRNPEDAPKPPPGALHPSIGSEGHAMGCCKRCCFFPRGRCANGYECEFCHYEHDKRKRKNKKKRTIRARQGFGNGATRLLLAKELMRSSASRPDRGGSRQAITVSAAAMERRPGAPMAAASCMQQAPVLLQAAGAGGATQLAWLAPTQGQQFLGYCQAADANVPRAQLAAAGQQQLLVYGGGAQQLATAQFYGAAAPTVGTACTFGPSDSVQVVVHNTQQPASHMIMLPPAMSQASVQGPAPTPMQRFCEPPPPPVQSPRLQRILGPAPPGMAIQR